MVTQTLVANGAKVYITGRRKEALETVVQKYSTAPGKIIVYVKYKSQNESISDQSLSLPGDITRQGGRVPRAKGYSAIGEQRWHCQRWQHKIQ
jgi:hypothetical protein